MSSAPPTVQVFIPTFNRRPLLERAIRSVLAQTYPSVEVAVLDNGSTDGTEAFMRELAASEPRVRYHLSPENLGMTANFNRIRGLVSQPYFCMLTDDDVYLPNFLDTAMGLFAAHPQAGFVGTNAPVRQDGKILQVTLRDWKEGFHPRGTKAAMCMRSLHPIITHCVFRAALAPEFVFHDSMRLVCDGVLLTCLATRHDMAISKTVTGYWEVHDGSQTQQHPPDAQEQLSYITRWGALYDEYCRSNGLPNRLRPQFRRRLLLALLLMKQPAEFVRALERDDVRAMGGRWQLAAVNAVRATGLIELLRWVNRRVRGLQPA